MSEITIGTKLVGCDGTPFWVSEIDPVATGPEGQALVFLKLQWGADGDEGYAFVVRYPDGITFCRNDLFDASQPQGELDEEAIEMILSHPRWVEMTTGADAVMMGGWPYLSPFATGPDARGSSYREV